MAEIGFPNVWDRKTWDRAIHQQVEALLAAAGIVEPPVEPLEIARSLDVTVVFDADQPTRGRFKRCGGREAIFLKPDVRRERLHWALAHELGELLAWRICESAGILGEDLEPGVREEIANRFSSCLLIPQHWFRQDLHDLDGDLLALKRRYSTASHEAIAWRMLEIEQPAIVSVCDQGRLTQRRSNLSRPCPAWQTMERQAWEIAYRQCVSVRREQSPYTVAAWPIHEPGWKREVVYLTWDEHEEDGGQLDAESGLDWD